MRAVVFQGGDEIQFSVYCDERRKWWLVYEYEFQPVAKKPLDLRELVRFGLARMNAATEHALSSELIWDFVFGITDSESS